MTELQGCIHYFEAELKPPCFLNPATSALFQSTLKFLKQFEDITARFPTLRLKSIPVEEPATASTRSLHHIKETLENTEVGK